MLEPPRNLLWRPLPPELVGHDARQGSALGQFAGLGSPSSVPRSLVGQSCSIGWAATFRLISRQMVDGARSSRSAMLRIESPATTALEISSRSASLSARLERRRSGGRMPPVSARIRCTDECIRSNTSNLMERGPLLPALSKPSGCPSSRSAVAASSATLLLPPAGPVCCIDRLNPQP